MAGTALTSNTTAMVLATGAVAVLMTCLLWWTYFGWVREVLEEALVAAMDRERARLGRDAYSLWHFPLVSGIIALAVGFEGAFHPHDYSVTQVAIAVGTGLTLFLVATAGALWRAVGCVLWNRLGRGGGNIGRLGTDHTLEPDSGAGHRMRGARHDCRRRTDIGSPAARASIALTLAGKRLVGDDSPSNEELSSCVDISTHCRPSVPS